MRERKIVAKNNCRCLSDKIVFVFTLCTTYSWNIQIFHIPSVQLLKFMLM